MLKNVLSLLLSKFYSKAESELVGHQAMPSSSWTAISLSQTTSDSWGAIGSYTAPSDGYVQLQGDSTAEASQVVIRTENNGEVRGSYLSRSNSQVSGVNLVVAKGQTCLLLSSHSKNLKARFYPIIGGGYQALKELILQGGAICLSNLCNSLRRSSCRAKRSGSATSLKPSYQGARLFPTPQPQTRKLSLRRAMELYALTFTVQNGQSSIQQRILEESSCILRKIKPRGKRSIFQLQKARQQGLTSPWTNKIPLSSSFQPLVLNMVKGGASC